MRKSINDRALYDRIISDLLKRPEIERMKTYEQHEGNNTLQHVLNVAETSFQLAEQLGWKIDEGTLARGAILHDYYLYTISEKGISDYDHGIHHPKAALENARKVFHLNPKEENIIRSHMWPLTLLHPPRSREAALVCVADKYCATREMLFHHNVLTGKEDAAKQ